MFDSKGNKLFEGEDVSKDDVKYRPTIHENVLNRILAFYKEKAEIEECKMVVNAGCEPGTNTAIVRTASLELLRPFADRQTTVARNCCWH